MKAAHIDRCDFWVFRIGLFHGMIYFYKFRSSSVWSSILICSGVVSTIAPYSSSLIYSVDGETDGTALKAWCYKGLTTDVLKK